MGFSKEKAPLRVMEDESKIGMQSRKMPLYAEETTTQRVSRRSRAVFPSLKNCSTRGVATKHFRYALLVILALCLFIFTGSAWLPAQGANGLGRQRESHLVKPDVKIVGLVFCKLFRSPR